MHMERNVAKDSEGSVVYVMLLMFTIVDDMSVVISITASPPATKYNLNFKIMGSKSIAA